MGASVCRVFSTFHIVGFCPLSYCGMLSCRILSYGILSGYHSPHLTKEELLRRVVAWQEANMLKVAIYRPIGPSSDPLECTEV